MTIEPQYVNREISWLKFNERVLQEALDRSVPLNERINFLAIFSSNLDEFFRVRVAGLRALLRLKKKQRKALAFDLEQLLYDIHHIVSGQQERFGVVFREDILPDLADHGLHLCDGRAIPEEIRSHLEAFIAEKVLSGLYKAILGEDPTPFMANDALYLAVELCPKAADFWGESCSALVALPPDLPRFVEVSSSSGRQVFFLDDVVRESLPQVFPDYEVGEAFAVKLTRDADLLVDDEFAGDLVEKIKQGVERRDEGAPSRFLFDLRMPHGMLLELQKTLHLEDEDLVGGGHYHNFSDLWALPRPDEPALSYPPMPPLPHPTLTDSGSLLGAISARDYLLHFPYHQFDPVIRLFEEAAADRQVEAISATLYRVAKDSAVVRALIQAAERGKQVMAFVEVKARFDEENNLQWAKRMEAAGVNVLYSLPGMKVHSKLALISRREGGRLRDYGYFGTGNFNENTARVYADHVLLTADPRLTVEARQLFAFLTGKVSAPQFDHLLVAPFTLRARLEALIDREIEHVEAGRRGAMTIKLNGLDDEGIIDKLYEASRAGVEVKMIVRGIFRAVAGVEGMSERIEARSIVDRFLEHARVYCFFNGGEREVYLASADWMNRNLTRRVEVGFPIYDDGLRADIERILEIQWADNTKARRLNAHQTNEYHGTEVEEARRAQFDTYDWLAERSEILTVATRD